MKNGEFDVVTGAFGYTGKYIARLIGTKYVNELDRHFRKPKTETEEHAEKAETKTAEAAK